jgi:hypothetical protein
MSDPYYKRSMTSPLFPDVTIRNDDDRCKAFIGRFQKADGGSIYASFMGPYAGPDGSYDTSNLMLERMYRKFLIDGDWSDLKFTRVTFWIIENRMEINQFTYARGSRLYDRSRLPTGKLEDMDYDTIMWIINGEDD